MTTRISHGVMTITLAGEEIDLAANVRASRTICRLYNGLTQAYQRVNEFDFDALVTIINAAAGRVGKAAEATADQVFDEGIIAVAPMVADYLGFLSAGGKAPKTAAIDPEAAGEAVEKATDEAAPAGES